MNQSHVVSQIIQKSAEYSEPFYVGFRDYEKAVVSVHTSCVLEAIKDQGIQEAYIRVLEDKYN